MIEQLLGAVGRQLPPDLPAVGALSEHDLERMAWEAMQAGDSEKVGRIQEIREMRQREQPAPDVSDQLLGPQRPEEPGILDRLKEPRTQLLDALNPKR